jgi:ankyrin repeat protein
VDLRSICASYAFLEHSTRYWSFHAGHIRDRNDNSEDSLLKLVCEKYKTHPVFHKLVEWEQCVRSKIGSYVTRHNDTYWYVCLDLDISAWSVEAYSLLHVMASHGLHHYLRRLLELTDHEVDSRDCDELTALFHAAQNGHPKTVKLLLEQGAKFNSADKNGRTPLSHAATSAYGSLETIELFLERGVEVDSKNTNDRTPLSYGAQYGGFETVELLLERGAEMDSKDKDGRTPLSYGTLHGHTETVALLLERGAEVDSKDKLGWTAI